MESPIDLVEFTATEATRIVSEDGTLCMVFEPGETLLVQRKLHKVALRAGLVPEQEVPAEIPVQRITESREEIVKNGLLEACKTLIMRGNPADFTTVGNPRAASLKKLVDFDFKTQEATEAFNLAMHEVEQDGNNSPEYSEPVSDTTE